MARQGASGSVRALRVFHPAGSNGWPILAGPPGRVIRRSLRMHNVTDTRTAGEQVQEEILKTVRNSQSAVVEAIQAWTRTVQSITLALPDANVPFAGKLPKPQELLASAYGFAEQLLASQRKFAEDVLEATAPMLAGPDDAPAPENGSTAK